MHARRPPRGGVDRNTRQPASLTVSAAGRPPRGGVDRNASASWAVEDCAASPPARGRGSKHVDCVRSSASTQRRPPRGGVDRNVARLRSTTRYEARRPPRGGVDRNYRIAAAVCPRARSPPARGRGSKPVPARCSRRMTPVAPRAGAWIETPDRRRRAVAVDRRPPRGGVDRNFWHGSEQLDVAWSPPARGRGSKPFARRRSDRRPTSPPARGRGSKRLDRARSASRPVRSPPARGRGSKHDRSDH